jgi:hypothetical protein
LLVPPLQPKNSGRYAEAAGYSAAQSPSTVSWSRRRIAEVMSWYRTM